MSRYTVPFPDAGDASLVGGKSASLGELTRAGFPVPPGFVVTTAAFHDVMTALDPDCGARARLARLDPGNLHAVDAAAAILRRRLEGAPIPEAVGHAVVSAYRELASGPSAEPPSADGPGAGLVTAPVAVRSSATAEDGADASFAGLQDTYLWVHGEQPVLAYLRRCWASLYNTASVVYRLRRGMSEDRLAMGVVVQQMVDPRCAGVMFTRSPLTGDRSVVAIEAAWGLGSALVSGEVTPDRYVVGKVTGEIAKRSVATKERCHRLDPVTGEVRTEEVPAGLRDARCLTDREIAALVAVARRVEDHFGTPQDIEWAIRGDAVFLLQSRPETVWSQREGTPVVPGRARAFDHVLDVLGGRR